MRRRTLAPFGRRSVELTDNRAVGAYSVLTCADRDGPAPRPGQFYMLAACERWGGGEGDRPFVPRACSFMRATADEDGGVRLEFLLEDVGPGTARLCALHAGERLWLLGPLGVGFAPPPAGHDALLVGGGIGIAPLAGWQDELRAAGISARTLLGFRDASHATGATLMHDPSVATDDGSQGLHGRVTELLAAERGTHATVFSCGPPAMLEAVRALCAERGIAAQLALESGMACGFGACFGCVVPTRAGYLRLCLDGPVIDAAQLETALVAGAGH
ncbi:MAG TPA: hypothetical protein VHE14_02375 [Solirubrobacteraceae bacterium]|nr:hypothetical protein [Solirubrobacteraceae bacterium]